MEKPNIADTKPAGVQLNPGQEYYWCACGLSKKQPFCDGSHSGTPFTPLACKVEEAQEAWLCTCKRTGTPPFCDGSHAKLSDNDG